MQKPAKVVGMTENQDTEKRVPKRPVGVWLPVNLIEKIDRKAAKIGLDRSEYIRMILMQTLGDDDEPTEETD